MNEVDPPPGRIDPRANARHRPRHRIARIVSAAIAAAFVLVAASPIRMLRPPGTNAHVWEWSWTVFGRTGFSDAGSIYLFLSGVVLLAIAAYYAAFAAGRIRRLNYAGPLGGMMLTVAFRWIIDFKLITNHHPPFHGDPMRIWAFAAGVVSLLAFGMQWYIMHTLDRLLDED